MICAECRQEFRLLTDRIVICGCQDTLAELAVVGNPPIAIPNRPPTKYKMSPALRNSVVSRIQVSSVALNFAGILTGSTRLTMQPQPINYPVPVNVIPACQKCGHGYHQLFDQFLVCRCPDTLGESVGTSAVKKYALSSNIKTTIVLATQIVDLTQQLSDVITGRGQAIVDGSQFGATHFGGR